MRVAQKAKPSTFKNCSPSPRRIFPPRDATDLLAGTRKFNKGALEVRVLRSGAASAEQVDFPCEEGWFMGKEIQMCE